MSKPTVKEIVELAGELERARATLYDAVVNGTRIKNGVGPVVQLRPQTLAEVSTSLDKWQHFLLGLLPVEESMSETNGQRVDFLSSAERIQTLVNRAETTWLSGGTIVTDAIGMKGALTALLRVLAEEGAL